MFSLQQVHPRAQDFSVAADEADEAGGHRRSAAAQTELFRGFRHLRPRHRPRLHGSTPRLPSAARGLFRSHLNRERPVPGGAPLPSTLPGVQ